MVRKLSFEKFVKDAKKCKFSNKCGMFLFHNGVVREIPKANVRNLSSKKQLNKKVDTMYFSYDKNKVDKYLNTAKKMKGIYYVNVWLNEGILNVGDDIMYVAVGGDIRPNVIKCLETFVNNLKSKCVIEKENLKENFIKKSSKKNNKK